MATSLIRGKYVICKVVDRAAAEVITDGAVVQRDGVIIAVSSDAAISEEIVRRLNKTDWNDQEDQWAL